MFQKGFVQKCQPKTVGSFAKALGRKIFARIIIAGCWGEEANIQTPPQIVLKILSDLEAMLMRLYMLPVAVILN